MTSFVSGIFQRVLIMCWERGAAHWVESICMKWIEYWAIRSSMLHSLICSCCSFIRLLCTARALRCAHLLALSLRACNSIIHSLPSAHEHTLVSLLYSNCVPILTYACNVKEYSSSDMSSCNTAVNNALRKVFGFSRWESIRTLREMFDMKSLYDIFKVAQERFLRACRSHHNQIVAFTASHLSVWYLNLRCTYCWPWLTNKRYRIGKIHVYELTSSISIGFKPGDEIRLELRLFNMGIKIISIPWWDTNYISSSNNNLSFQIIMKTTKWNLNQWIKIRWKWSPCLRVFAAKGDPNQVLILKSIIMHQMSSYDDSKSVLWWWFIYHI